MKGVGVSVETHRFGAMHSFINERMHGAEGIRTPDPLVANEVLSQLSYSPEYLVSLKVLLYHTLAGLANEKALF